jgi:hypothetical protein
MYKLIKSGIAGKSSSCRFMLHHPKNASISSCMWLINRKDKNSCLKMSFATDKKQ